MTTDFAEKLYEEKVEQVEYLVDIIRQIYAVAGEDDNVNDLCNKVLEDPFSSHDRCAPRG